MSNFSPGGVWLASETGRAASRPVEPLTAPCRLIFPMGQRPGAFSKPCVKKGQQVRLGQPLALEGEPHSCPVHSSVSGRVADIVEYRHPLTGTGPAVVVENDGRDTPYAPGEGAAVPPLDDAGIDALPAQEILSRIRAAGVLSQPRPALPLWERLEAMSLAGPETLVLNAVETEPFACRSRKLLDENPEETARGLKLLMRACGAGRVLVAVGDDEGEEAADVLKACLLLEVPASLRRVPRKYPVQNELILKRTLLRQEHDKSAGFAFAYVQECLQTLDAVRGLPQTRQVLTVSGDAVENPQNLLVRVGTPVEALLDRCGLSREPGRVVLGSPLRGRAVPSLDIPVLKSDTEVLALTDAGGRSGIHACIGCGACVRACPQGLLPNYLALYALKADFGACRRLRIERCIECGACAYVCPGRVPILELVKNLRRAGA